jgi:uncharacterized BrkB/YihY/UPF0761 family membrane protein
MPESETDEKSAAGRLVAAGRSAASDGRRRADDLFAKHRDRPLVGLGVEIYERDRESAGTIVGAAVALRLFLFFVPLLLLVVGVVGVISSWIDAKDLKTQVGVTGTLAAQIDTALSQPGSSRWLAVGFGLLGVVTTGRSLSKVLVSTSCLAWRLPVRGKASVRVVGVIVGLFTGLGLLAVVVNRIRADLGIAVAGVSLLAVFVIYGVGWIVLSMALPSATPDPGAMLPGGVVFGATFAGMQAVSQLYLPSKLDRASQLYGALGVTVVVLGWFFIAGRAIVLATVFNAVIYERFGSISKVMFGLPVLRILPQRSRWLRGFFDLEPDAGPTDGERGSDLSRGASKGRRDG